MNFTKLLPNIQNKLEHLYIAFPILKQVIQVIHHHKGKAYLVGGAVRDILLNIPLIDIDIEVHNIELNKLSEILSTLGTVSLVGKSFGVLKLFGTPIECSLPRIDNAGRKPEVHFDPYLSIEQALRRRDLTMNAMALDLITTELIDPFNGYQDMQQHILRSPDIHFFTQDPLRFFRVMQFIGRFSMQPDEALNLVCSTMSLDNISKERIESEFDKLMLKSPYPSLGIRWLCQIGRLQEILPEIAATCQTPQNPEWHPEGFVFEHLMQALDAAAKLSYIDKEHKLIILYAALCHDIGKAVTTQWLDGRWRSKEHAQAGVPLTYNLLKRITNRVKFIEQVSALVKYHMEPFSFIKNNASAQAYKHLAVKLDRYNLTLEHLTLLLIADRQGRNGTSSFPLTDPVAIAQEFIQYAQAASVFTYPEKPLLQGKDLLDTICPGPIMGKALSYAYQQQLRHSIKNKELLKAQVIKQFSQT